MLAKFGPPGRRNDVDLGTLLEQCSVCGQKIGFSGKPSAPNVRRAWNFAASLNIGGPSLAQQGTMLDPNVSRLLFVSVDSATRTTAALLEDACVLACAPLVALGSWPCAGFASCGGRRPSRGGSKGTHCQLVLCCLACLAARRFPEAGLSSECEHTSSVNDYEV